MSRTDEALTGNRGLSMGGDYNTGRVPVGSRPVVQRPGQAEILQRVFVPDPRLEAQARDRRLHVDTATLRRLLAIAESSPSGRVVCHGIHAEVELLRSPDGHQFENWRLHGAWAAEGTDAELANQRYQGQLRDRLVR